MAMPVYTQQCAFVINIHALIRLMEDYGQSFIKQSNELGILHSTDNADDFVRNTVKKCRKLARINTKSVKDRTAESHYIF